MQTFFAEFDIKYLGLELLTVPLTTVERQLVEFLSGLKHFQRNKEKLNILSLFLWITLVLPPSYLHSVKVF